MACLDMYSSSSSSSSSTSNQNSKPVSSSCTPMSPRISFSNDFVDPNHSHQQQMIHKQPRSSESPASDFEFSVTNYSMMSADELFFKGRLLPSFKKPPTRTTTTTLREELLVDDDDDGGSGGFTLRPPKGWKEILGLKKAHIGSKKPPKADGLSSVEKEAHASNSSQEVLNEEESSCRDLECGF